MKIDIINEKESPLLSRKSVTAKVSFEGATPSRAQLRGALAKKADASEDNTMIKHVYPAYGDTGAEVVAHIYTGEDVKKTYEPEALLKKHVKEEPKKEEAPAAEAPAEDKKEESPAEEAAPAEEKAEEKPADK